MAITVGVLYAAAFYMLMRRSVVKLIIGLLLLSHATNLLIFSSGGLTRNATAIVPEGATAPEGAYADPLPQALILTAIVISFGVAAFSVVLVHRVHKETGSDDLDNMRSTDT